jgi:hypothetical protein
VHTKNQFPGKRKREREAIENRDARMNKIKERERERATREFGNTGKKVAGQFLIFPRQTAVIEHIEKKGA